jgi:acyl-CoA synthetase (NDP forming)
VISADEASEVGLTLAKFSPETMIRLREKMPKYSTPRNPLDLVGDADVERYRLALNAVSSDDAVGIVLVIVLLQTSFIESDVVDAITESQVTYGKPTIVCTVGGEFTQILVKMLEESRIPSYSTPERAVNAINALVRYAKALEEIRRREESRIPKKERSPRDS